MYCLHLVRHVSHRLWVYMISKSAARSSCVRLLVLLSYPKQHRCWLVASTWKPMRVQRNIALLSRAIISLDVKKGCLASFFYGRNVFDQVLVCVLGCRLAMVVNSSSFPARVIRILI